MKKLFVLLTLGLSLCLTTSAFQGGGGESTKKKAGTKKNAATRSTTVKSPRSVTTPTPRQKQMKSARPLRNAVAEINVRTTPPNSLISIDGESIGVTDEDGWLKLPSLKPGVYTVSASKVGHLPSMKVVRLLAGGKETVDLSLTGGTQTLNVVSTPPQADVYIDGVHRGSTDSSGKATITGVAFGEHEVTLRKSRYRDAVFPLSISSGKVGQIKANLELTVGYLTVRASSPNSLIEISGIGKFEGGFDRIECPPGIYAVTISSPSYVTSKTEVTVEAGQEAKLFVDLVANNVRSQSKVATGSSETVSPRSANYIVPSGLMINGILENEINTKNSKNYDRFRMTIQSPEQFRGATIEGYVSGVGRAGKVKGQSSVTFNFEKITIGKGQTYDLAGNLLAIKDHEGKTVKVDNEGTAKGNSKTKKTVKRGGIGAGIGAVVGGILGGAAGAAAGAAIGGAAGAGSAAVENEDIKLKKGSTITLQTSSPNRQNKTP